MRSWLIAAAIAVTAPIGVCAQPAGGDPTVGCTAVGVSDAKAILGYDVQAPDDVARSGGICSFVTQRATEEGIVAYSVVTAATLDEHKQFFRVKARLCGNVQPNTPNYPACMSYFALAAAGDLDAYYAARTGVPEARLLPALGTASVTPTAVYVKRGGEVFECVVRRSEFLDVDRSVALAQLLLARVAPLEATPQVSASPS